MFKSETEQDCGENLPSFPSLSYLPHTPCAERVLPYGKTQAYAYTYTHAHAQSKHNSRSSPLPLLSL